MRQPRPQWPRPGTPPAPECDPHLSLVGTPDFIRAEALAHKHGLTYLSISGVVKLLLLIKDIESQHDATTTDTSHALKLKRYR